MAQKSLLFLLVGTAFLVGTSFESPIIDCGHLSDRQASPAERIQEFIECLKQEGHDEELLTELKKSYETGNNAQRSSSTSSSNCSPETGFDEKGRFPYCSGMSDLQCRTLTLVLESLLSVPATANAMGIGSSSTEKLLRETLQPIIPRDSSEDENNIQGALMHVILTRFSDILDEYRRWRATSGGRMKRATDETPDAEIRVRRQAAPMMPFKLPEKLTPEMQAVLEGYLAWREKNGYGKMSGRWG